MRNTPALTLDIAAQAGDSEGIPGQHDRAFELQGIGVKYAGVPAIRNVTLDIYRNRISALIGPSGCGKSTLLRCLNRMNDLIPAATVEGRLLYEGENLCSSEVDAVEVRKRIGMVFQKPNPFPQSIYENVAYGPRVLGRRRGLDEVVERSLRRAALWDEVKDRLKADASSLSGGQQQRLCIARALANDPDVILMDEPCSALDPIATMRIEDLMEDLKREFTIVIVTHNMQQAARVSDWTAFLTVDLDSQENRTGELVEYGPTERMFLSPSDRRTQNYVTGRFG